MSLQRQIIIFFCVLFTITITGCSSSIWDRYPAPTPVHGGLVGGAIAGAAIGGIAAGGAGAGLGAVMGGVVGASIGDIFQAHMTEVDWLQYHGVEVIRLGDEVELILPTRRFFRPNSPQMNMQYYGVMDKIGDFIRKFQKISVKVAGFTDDRGPWQRNLALSTAQAQAVMQYLWNYGIDTRLIYAQGYGGAYPIANNDAAQGRALNCRIEITLRRIRNRNHDS